MILLFTVFGGTSGCAGSDRGEPGLESRLALARQQMAGGQLETAHRILVDARPLTETDEERVRLAILTGDCLAEMAQYSAASDEYFRARALAENEDADLTYRATIGLARSRLAEGQTASGERHLLEAVSLATTAEQRDRAYFDLARSADRRGDLQSARRYAAKIEDGRLLGVAELRTRLVGAAPVVKVTEEPIKLPSVLQPEIIERARWGARPIRSAGRPEPMEKPWRVTVHHSAEPEKGPTGFAQAADQMRRYQTFHQNDRGWADIGYHYVIDGSGRIWEGREVTIQGAHAGNRDLNRGNIGVCLMGNFSQIDPTADQKKSLRRLLSWLCESRGIHPRFVVGHRAGMRSIEKDTLCPGARLEAYLIRLIPFLPRP